MRQISTIIMCWLLANAFLWSAEYYVSPSGSDQNTGSQDKPFATIQHAVNTMSPGDTTYLRAGVYYEAVDFSGKAGAAGAALSLKAYPGEVVTMDGTSKLDSEWVVDEGSVFKTMVEQDVTQLFVDGKLMTLARFPNALAFSDEVWHRTGVRCTKSRESTNGHVVDASQGEKSIAEAGISFNGCVALLNFGAHATTSRIVQNHAAGSKEFDYSPKLHKYKTTLNYFFEGGVGNAERSMLDIPQEWAFDESRKTLYLWADDGKNPNARDIRSKVRTYAITGDAATKHIVIDGLNFFATTFSFNRSDHIDIRNCRFNYYASSRRSLGVLGPSETAHFTGDPEDFCSDITIYNCEFKYADASALIGSYVEDITIENNLFSHIDYACVNNDLTGDAQGYQASITLRITKGKNLVYRRNTMSVSGNAQTVAASMHGVSQRRFKPEDYDPTAFAAPIFEYNFHTACGLLHTDGSSLYMAHANVTESVSRFNWFISNGQRDYRWDGNNKPLQGVHGNLYRNVAVGTKLKRMSPSGGNGFRVKGSYHEVYHNLGLGRGGELNVAITKGGNDQTVTRNNAASMLTDHPMPGTHSNNYGDKRKAERRLTHMLRDSANWDFRPREDAVELIDQGVAVTCSVKGEDLPVNEGFNGTAPDLGVYEWGDEVYWIPGRQEAGASMPIPKHEGQNVPLDADLMYLIGLSGVKAEVYFGKEPEGLVKVATKNDPQNIVSLTGAQQLEPGSTYYWRVDTQRADGTLLKGEVWSFATTAEN